MPTPRPPASTIKVGVARGAGGRGGDRQKGKLRSRPDQKDFKVWEDNKEQTITSFSFDADADSPNHTQKQYLVLFFDNSTMEAGDQVAPAQAAAQFIDANAGPNRLMAVVDFGGSVSMAQNFTADADRLKQVVATVKGSAVSPNARCAPVQIASLATPAGMPGHAGNIPHAEELRSRFRRPQRVAGLAQPGQESGGRSRPQDPGDADLRLHHESQLQSELTAAIDACNKANVAVYPIDVRGLAGPALGELRIPRGSRPAARARGPHSGHLVFTTFNSGASSARPSCCWSSMAAGLPAVAAEAAE